VNDIKLEREVEAALPAVTADAHQLEQVFLNIINNAVDAMLEIGRGGTLEIRVYGKDGYVHAEFRDSGPGIKEPNRIFDPFYTTKNVGKGTGLGLSICYGIIKEHGGEIRARNHDQKGAIIEVRLPAGGHGELAQAPAAPRRESAIEGHILLVEDEDAVMEFERDVLAGAGAEIVTLMNADSLGPQLLRHCFDALIINGKLPGKKNAQDIYQLVSETCPGLEKRLLFTFSTVIDPKIRRFLEEKQLPHLVKPFEVADLISQTRRLLQKAHAATV
jgi:two-component system, NtrC family, sensor kinase